LTVAYANARTIGPGSGPFADLDVPPSRRILARTVGPYSYDPNLGGFWDVVTAPFKAGAKVVTGAAKGAYQVGRFAVRKVPQAAIGFATAGPVGAAAAVGASIVRDLARRGGGQPGQAGAYPTAYPAEYGYGPNTLPAFASPWQGNAGAYPTPPPPRPAPAPSTTDTLLKFAPLAVGALLLLRK
jgi:hypothetical protein